MLTSLEHVVGAKLTTSFLKNQLDLFFAKQKQHFVDSKQSVDSLLLERSQFIDSIVKRLWLDLALSDELALFAVGGYGRQELHPLSDIDLLVLSSQALDSTTEQKISDFITKLWDLKLVIGHSVRTFTECVEIGKKDLSVATSLQEARLITGNSALAKKLRLEVFSENFWSSIDFFHAKVQEQKDRYKRFNETAYNLEPDIKSSPGGMRDIHTLNWIAQRHFDTTNLHEMRLHGFLTANELAELKECQYFLWKIRFALHLLLKRVDNRLTFAYQQEVSEILGFSGSGNSAVEQMMKGFYRTLARVTELNQMLMPLMAKEIQGQNKNPNWLAIDKDFQCQEGEIAAVDTTLFHSQPEKILTLFWHIAQNANLTSIATPTLRQLRAARHNMSTPLSKLAVAREKFVALIKHPNVLNKAIPLMHKHGVFSAYLSAWQQIVGQMQFDLFHAYTVDEHTIRLLKHINRFSDKANSEKHPICCEVFPTLAKPELLLLAAIFHDIAKGRGGDHSEIGAIDAYDFCLQHDFSESDAKLVSWLVEKHLLMSVTAQRRDIHDPNVIQEFVQQVQSLERLNYLICLTVADICATNPTLWNSWKRTLLSELYHASFQSLQTEKKQNALLLRRRIRQNKAKAKEKLIVKGFSELQIDKLWLRFKADYFLRHNIKQIIWHSEQILQHDGNKPLCIITDKNTKGSTEIFIYAKDKPSLFARVVDALDRKNLSVHDAQILTSKDSFTLDTFIVLDARHKKIPHDRYQSIIDSLVKTLSQCSAFQISTKGAPTKLQAFNIKPKVEFLSTHSSKKTLLELEALDTPGLLAKIGAVLSSLNISLQAAKITTIGERAEDFFIVSSNDNRALDENAKQALKTHLLEVLS